MLTASFTEIKPTLSIHSHVVHRQRSRRRLWPRRLPNRWGKFAIDCDEVPAASDHKAIFDRNLETSSRMRRYCRPSPLGLSGSGRYRASPQIRTVTRRLVRARKLFGLVRTNKALDRNGIAFGHAAATIFFNKVHARRTWYKEARSRRGHLREEGTARARSVPEIV